MEGLLTTLENQVSPSSVGGGGGSEKGRLLKDFSGIGKLRMRVLGGKGVVAITSSENAQCPGGPWIRDSHKKKSKVTKAAIKNAEQKEKSPINCRSEKKKNRFSKGPKREREC